MLFLVLLLVPLALVEQCYALTEAEQKSRIQQSQSANEAVLTMVKMGIAQRPASDPAFAQNPITGTLVSFTNTTPPGSPEVDFVLAALHTTPEKTGMYSKKYNAYLTQTIVAKASQPIAPLSTGAAWVNEISNKIPTSAQIIDVRVVASRLASRRHDHAGVLQCTYEVFTSNNKTKPIPFKSTNTLLNFPQDFILTDTSEKLCDPHNPGNNTETLMLNIQKANLKGEASDSGKLENLQQSHLRDEFLKGSRDWMHEDLTKNSFVGTWVNVTNKSDKPVVFMLAALHTTNEKTPMYSKKFNTYVTQTIVGEGVAVDPNKTGAITVNDFGLKLGHSEKILGLMAFASKLVSTTRDVKRTGGGGGESQAHKLIHITSEIMIPGGIPVKKDNVILGYISPEDLKKFALEAVAAKGYLTVQEAAVGPTFTPLQITMVHNEKVTVKRTFETYISDIKNKPFVLQTAQNHINFPDDFIFNDKVEQETDIPNADYYIGRMKAAENRHNKLIFPRHYFRAEVIESLPEEELRRLGSRLYDLLDKPIPHTQATLGTLLDVGKYNGIMGMITKLIFAPIMLIVSGNPASFVMDVVDAGRGIHEAVKDLKARR